MVEYMLSTKSNELAEECGNVNLPEVCKYVLAYSPYHIDVPETLHTDVLIMADDANVPLRQHSYKFAAKLRAAGLKKNVVLLKTLANPEENEKYAYALAFLIKSLYQHEEE